MKNILPALLLFALFGFSQNTFAQDKKDDIAKVVSDYFQMERENIHVHFDKDIFLSNEKIWFKGYVLNRNLNRPSLETINIFASLINSDGTILETKLLYGDGGSFSGSFDLGDKFSSGKYYVQFYTNWMNNFYEDESAVYDITVVNSVNGIPAHLSKEFAEINISLRAEGNVLLQGISNTIGISVLNCNGTPTKASQAELLDSKGAVVNTAPLNKAGYGKFILKPDNQNYTVSVTVNGTKHTQPLMAAQVSGFTLEANSYILPDKTTIKVRSTGGRLSGKPLYLMIHKDGNNMVMELDANNKDTEQVFVIPNTDLFQGLNTIRLLDSSMNQLAERLIYIYSQSGVSCQIDKDNEEAGYVALTGTVSAPNSNLSVAVLPSRALDLKNGRDMMGDLSVIPYLQGHQSFPARSYLNTITRGSKYETDLFLLCQQSKYNWHQMRTYPPKQNHSFDMGLELTGKINQVLKTHKNYKVKILSLGNLIDADVPIDDKNEFTFKNRILLDSTNVSFKLIKNGEQPVTLKLYPRVLNNIRNFNKAYKPENMSCTPIPGTEELAVLPVFMDKNVITLDEVEINEKVKLKYERVSGNAMLRGYKITDVEAKSFFYVLDLIRYHGFNVSQDRGNVSITGRNITTINGQKTEPMIYMDNIRVMDNAQLIGVQTSDVDEFYVNQHAIVPSVDNKMGIVRMYMKKSFGKSKNFNPEVDFMIKNGFEKVRRFSNIEYNSTEDAGFQNFGIIDWQPAVTTDEKGNFTIYVPKLYSGEVKVIIEGFSPDGKLISEVRTITL